MAKTFKQQKGFDSLYLDEGDKKSFRMKYMVFDSENVILSHVIKCKIAIQEELQAEIDKPDCQYCGEQTAVKYCLNCEQYFCDEHDHEIHNESDADRDPRHIQINKIMYKHKRVHVKDRPTYFGTCQEHPKEQTRINEYYDKVRQKAFCADCAIDMQHGRKNGITSLVPIQNAYQQAKKTAMNQPDSQCLEKNKIIKSQMDKIKISLDNINS